MAPQPQKQNEAPKTEILAPKVEAKAPEKAVEAVNPELEQLRAENARLKLERRQLEAAMRAAEDAVLEDSRSEQSEGRSFRNAAGQLVDEKYRGVKQYRVGAAGAYREGRHYTEGEIITLVDAVPSRTWTPYEKKAAPAAVEAPPADTSRDADAAI